MKYKNKQLLKINIHRIIINIILLSIILLSILNIFFIPKIDIISKDEVELNQNYIPQYTASNFFNNYTEQVKVKNNVKTDKEGNYEVTYTLKYLFFTIKKKQIVSVLYTGIPTITLLGRKNVTICPNSTYQEEGYSAYDNYHGDLTNKVKIYYQDDSIIYKIKNRSGKEAIEKRIIKYEDNEKPIIKLKGSKEITLIKGYNYKEQGYEVSDNCDTDLNSQVKISGTVDTNTIGTYILTYQITDSSKNTNSTTRTIHIIEPNSNQSKIYLTFDDGPSYTSTTRILDILKEEMVPATFFVTRKSDDLNYLLQREKEEGHSIGLHTASHNYSKIYSSIDAYFEDLTIIHDKVYKVTNIDTKIIRFPGGSSNTISKKYTNQIMTTLTKKVVEEGYNYFDWNVDSNDAGNAKNPEDVYKNVIDGLQKGRSNVVLMHDFENNYKTIEALKQIIEYGKSNGYTFEKITIETPPIRHQVNN